MPCMSAIEFIVKPRTKSLRQTGWRRVVAAALLACGLSACGQKGPLFIPATHATPTAMPSTPSVTP